MTVISRGTTPFTKFRLLISGEPNTGKTTSIPTFLYGMYDYNEDKQRSDAESVADGKSMVIISCPGEVGNRSLLPDTPQLNSYYFEYDPHEKNKMEQSSHLLMEFWGLFKETEKNKPDYLFVDGIHQLYDHMMIKITNGLYARGEDLAYDPDTGKSNKYRASAFYNTAYRTFGQVLSELYASPIPFVGVTVWEEYRGGDDENVTSVGIDAQRYLWPDLPGRTAKRIVGRFDARISAKVHTECIHKNCPDDKNCSEHHVWQFIPKNTVRGVGIKGLRVNPTMQKKPYIHQNAVHLMALINQATGRKAVAA